MQLISAFVFLFVDSAIPLLSKSQYFKPLAFSVATDLVGNPVDMFSHDRLKNLLYVFVILALVCWFLSIEK